MSNLFSLPTRSSRFLWRMSRSPSCKRKPRSASNVAARRAKYEMAQNEEKYRTWSHESLIEKVTQLERELKEKTESFQPAAESKSLKKPRMERQFDPAKYNTRLIALKLAYLGKAYNGFEHHVGNTTPLPTIEEELWKALSKAKLIFPQQTNGLPPGEVNWEGCEYSKCGRTDKGVSAFGQVIGIRVRSNRPLSKQPAENSVPNGSEDGGRIHAAVGSISSKVADAVAKLSVDTECVSDAKDFDPIADEIPYASILNRLLPPDIRILAWCPSPPPNFSARFSCRERQYRYFFTQPAFSPIPGNLEDPNATSPTSMKDGWLDIDAMRVAAKSFEGLHDFRNFCKVDPGKQISNFERRIFYADIEEVDDNTGALAYVHGPAFRPKQNVEGAPKVYTFTLHGSAFLWHQVRHMVAVLFFVGQGLEPPSIVAELLDAEKNPCRPTYEMASDTPLVLWNCVFAEEEDEKTSKTDVLQWEYIGSGAGQAEAKFGSPGLMDDLWKVWREKKIDEILAGTLMEVAANQGNAAETLSMNSFRKGGKSQKLFDGGDRPLLRGTYIPVMKKPRLETVEVINEKYAVRKGFESAKEMKELGFRRMNGKAEEVRSDVE